MSHANEQIPKVRNAEDQNKEAAAKIQQHHRRISWPKPERHPKAMSTAVGVGSHALAGEGGEG